MWLFGNHFKVIKIACFCENVNVRLFKNLSPSKLVPSALKSRNSIAFHYVHVFVYMGFCGPVWLSEKLGKKIRWNCHLQYNLVGLGITSSYCCGSARSAIGIGKVFYILLSRAELCWESFIDWQKSNFL